MRKRIGPVQRDPPLGQAGGQALPPLGHPRSPPGDPAGGDLQHRGPAALPAEAVLRRGRGPAAAGAADYDERQLSDLGGHLPDDGACMHPVRNQPAGQFCPQAAALH